jgi:hypothetical protein
MSRVSLRDGRDETAAERANGMRIAHPSLAQQEGFCRSTQADLVVGVGRQTAECNYMFAPAYTNCLAAIWIRGRPDALGFHLLNEVTYALDNFCDSARSVVAGIGEFVHSGRIHPHILIGHSGFGAGNQSDLRTPAGALKLVDALVTKSTRQAEAETSAVVPGPRSDTDDLDLSLE